MSYYSFHWHPLLVAAPYIGAGAVVIAVELSVRRVRRWWNGLLPDREPSPVKAPPHAVTRPYDRESIEEDGRARAMTSLADAYGRRSPRLPELFSPISKTDRAIQSKLWPNVIPLREVAGPSTKRARR